MVFSRWKTYCPAGTGRAIRPRAHLGEEGSWSPGQKGCPRDHVYSRPRNFPSCQTRLFDTRGRVPGSPLSGDELFCD